MRFIFVLLFLTSTADAAPAGSPKAARVLQACSDGNAAACVVYRDCFELKRQQVCDMIAFGRWLPDGRLKMVPPGLPLTDEGKPGGNPAVMAVLPLCVKGDDETARRACATLWGCREGWQTVCENIVSLAGRGPLPTPDEIPPPPHGADTWLRFMPKTTPPE